MFIISKDIESKIANLCIKHNVSNLYIYGSALTENFNVNSDLDFAVIFHENLSPLEHGESFFNLLNDLEILFVKKIDLLAYRAIKNPVFKQELDNTKVPIYAAA
jgi:predicted nucleotidyltransferase